MRSSPVALLITFILILHAISMNAAVTKETIHIHHDFPGGNIIVEEINGNVITLKPDLRDTKGHWFYWYFEVNGAEGRTLTFQFKGGKSIGARGPAVSHDEGDSWHWLNDSHIPEAEAFTYAFRENQSSVRFAFCLPYTLRDWNAYAQNLPDRFKQGTLCTTKQGREVPMVCYGTDKETNTLIVMTGRQHACETTPDFVIEGFLNRWADLMPAGLSLLVVPLMDLDGVENGDQGKNRIPHDHNRDFNEVHIYPETLALRKRLENWPGKVVVLDMHSPYIREGDAETVYLVGSKFSEMAEKQAAFSKLLEENVRGLPYSPSNNVLFGEKWNTLGNSRKGKSLASFGSGLPNCVFSSTIEIPYANAQGTEITLANLEVFGHSLLETVIQYLSNSNDQPERPHARNLKAANEMTNSSKPNILLIHSDQFRADCLGIERHPCLNTPNLDHLSALGARMTKAYSECPICIPARHALMTGMAPDASGVVGFAMKARIARPEATLPELLRQAGYQTAMVGRNMHTYPKGKRYGFETIASDPFSEFYSRFHTIRHHSKAPGFQLWPHRHQHGLQNNGITAGPWPFDDEFHETNFSINKALEFLDYRDPEAPFFLATGFVAPHPPLTPPRHYYDRFAHMELDEPVIGGWAERPENDGLGLPVGCGKQVLEGDKSRQARAGYYGLINHIDDQLLLLLERIQSEPDTYVFFISDHGEMLGDHYFFRKSCPYEGSMRIPFMLSGPGIEPNQIIDRPVALQDILPTCCEIAGIEIPDHVTGQSVMPLITGKADSSWREYLHAEHAPMDDQHPGWHCLVNDRWKYIWFNDGREQLFDVEQDPKELNDLAGDHTFRNELSTWRNHLIAKLKDRPEGFSDGTQLISGRPYSHAMPHTVTDP